MFYNYIKVTVSWRALSVVQTPLYLTTAIRSRSMARGLCYGFFHVCVSLMCVWTLVALCPGKFLSPSIVKKGPLLSSLHQKIPCSHHLVIKHTDSKDLRVFSPSSAPFLHQLLWLTRTWFEVSLDETQIGLPTVCDRLYQPRIWGIHSGILSAVQTFWQFIFNTFSCYRCPVPCVILCFLHTIMPY